jgi:uncharacterized protein YaaQ
MKLIVTIVEDADADDVMNALTKQHNIRVTRVSSTGGLIIPGNSTLLIGVDEQRVPQVTKVIAELAARHPTFVPYAYAGSTPIVGVTEVQAGGYLTFVLDVDHFEQV